MYLRKILAIHVMPGHVFSYGFPDTSQWHHISVQASQVNDNWTVYSKEVWTYK